MVLWSNHEILLYRGGCCFRDLSLSLSLNRRSFPEADLLLSSSLPHTWKKTYRQVLSLFPRTEFFFKKSLNMNF